MPKKEVINFGETPGGKILRWFFLTVFAITFGSALLFYNLYTITSEKNIKKLGEELIADFLYKNKAAIDEIYSDLINYAKEYPEENIEFPTGLKDLTVNIRGKELSEITQEEFYKKMPAVIADNIYRGLLDSFIDNNIKNNEKIPKILRAMFSKINKDNRLFVKNVFILSSSLAAFSSAVFLMLSKTKKSKALLDIGAAIIIVSLPAYLLLYLTLPITNSVIRKTDFVTIASMITSMMESMLRNYLYVLFSGIFIFSLGAAYLLGFRLRNLKIKKKSEFERIIRA